MSCESISEQVGKTGLCIWPDFLSKESLIETRADFDEIQRSGGFVRASTGQGKDKEIRDLRRDEVYWIDNADTNPVQNRLLNKLDLLKTELNRTLFLGITHFEGHYSAYPSGGFYRRHLDCFHKDDARIVTLVLYLNRNWKSADGGNLRIYDKDSYTDVDPHGGTLVCFLSRESEHEVLENHEPRSSFTGWFKANTGKDWL